MKRVLVCGSRTYGHTSSPADIAAIQERDHKHLPSSVIAAKTLFAHLNMLRDELSYQGGMVLIEGGAPGADGLAAAWAANVLRYQQGGVLAHEQYPADWERHGKAAGPIRNQQMLDTGIDLCLAFIDKPLEESKGTKDMVTRCRDAGVFTIVTEIRP